MFKSIQKNIASFLQKLAILYRATFFIFSGCYYTCSQNWKNHVQTWQPGCHLHVAASVYAVRFFNRLQNLAAYMVWQKSRNCRASFVADVAKSVADKGRVFLVFLIFIKKWKKIMLTILKTWSRFWKFMVRKSKSMCLLVLEKGNRNLDILEMSKKHHIFCLFKTGLFYKCVLICFIPFLKSK